MPSTPNYVGLLELALAKPNGPNVATPFDNPIPWRWETWRDVTDGAVAPWLEEATEENTGLAQGKLHAIRAFCQQYFSEPDKTKRRALASSPSANSKAGRDYLCTWLTMNWAKWKINKVFDDAFEEKKINVYSMGLLMDGEEVRTLDLSGLDGLTVTYVEAESY